MTLQRKSQRMPLHGVLLLDKPAGMSSTQALAKAKWLLNAQKAGHTGTLDPFATGLLPLCFGEATKFAQDLLYADKTYEAVVHLGVTTTTGDTEGEVVESRPVEVSVQQIELVLAQFCGPIRQVPPMYSALKRDGKPLYEYARQGVTLEREARSVIIHQLDLLCYDAPYIKLRVTSSKGTYVRVLGEDIGKALGCGAHLKALRRTGVGSLSLDDAVALDDLVALGECRSNALKPLDALLSTLPSIELNDELARRFICGQRLSLIKEAHTTLLKDTGTRVKVMDIYGQLLGVATLSLESLLTAERLVSSVDRDDYILPKR